MPSTIVNNTNPPEIPPSAPVYSSINLTYERPDDEHLGPRPSRLRFRRRLLPAETDGRRSDEPNEDVTQPSASPGVRTSTVSYDGAIETGAGSPLPSDHLVDHPPLPSPIRSVVRVLTSGRFSRLPNHGPIRITIEVPDVDVDDSPSLTPPSPAPVQNDLDRTAEEIPQEYRAITAYDEWEEEGYRSRPPSPPAEYDTEAASLPSPRAVSFYETLTIHDTTFGEIPTRLASSSNTGWVSRTYSECSTMSMLIARRRPSLPFIMVCRNLYHFCAARECRGRGRFTI